MANKRITAAELIAATPKKKRVTPEAELTKQVVDFLEAHGWRAIRMSRGVATFGDRGTVTFGEPGMPDWLFLKYVEVGLRPHALAVWVEFKRHGAVETCVCLTKKPRSRCTKCDQITWKSREQFRGAQVHRIESLEQVKEGKWWN